MRKYFLTLSFVLLSVILLKAQEYKFGIKGSYNIPIYDWNFSPENFDEKTSGFTLGVYLDYLVKNNSSLRVGVNLSSYELSLSSETGFITTYIETPVFYRLELKKDLGLFAYIGLGFGFNLVEDTYWSTSDPFSQSLPVFMNYKDNYLNNTRVFLPLGIAYDLDFGLSFDIGFSWNINDMGTDENIQFLMGFNSVHLGLGYTF